MNGIIGRTVKWAQGSGIVRHVGYAPREAIGLDTFVFLVEDPFGNLVKMPDYECKLVPANEVRRLMRDKARRRV